MPDETVIMYWTRRRETDQIGAGEIRLPRLLPYPTIGQIFHINGVTEDDEDNDDEYVVDDVRVTIRVDDSVQLWFCLRAPTVPKLSKR